jgi:hypothetical protein
MNPTDGKTDAPRAPLFGVPDLPERVLETYARLWQLETWIRHLVYVHLRAKSGDAWEGHVHRAMNPKNSDKRLTHMPTADESLLSYAQLSELRAIIAGNWSMFESYLPPQNIWEAKLDEVSQIRHRVAHFRSTHADDLPRVVQLLRDVDGGFWRFCTFYNDSHPVLPAIDDPVTMAFIDLDRFPWSDVGNNRWARMGHAAESDRITVTVEVLRMPWAEWTVPVAGKEGFLYDVNVHARGQWHHDFDRLLKSTRALHKHLVHICLESAEKSFRFTIPAVLGEDLIARLISALHDAALNTVKPGLSSTAAPDDKVQRFADGQPEYVLGPNNPLTFLSPDMPCSMFGV